MKNKPFAKKKLTEVFADSYISEIIVENNKMIIIIKMDTGVSPGKPYGILKIINPKEYEKILKSQKSLCIVLHELKVLKKSDGYLVVIETVFIPPDDYFEIPCENFFFKRVETYKKNSL
jgi:hypothetical protein